MSNPRVVPVHGRYKAALFDMDGLLLDTERMSLRACQETLQRFGVVRSFDSLRAFVGKPQRVVAAEISDLTGVRIEVEAYLSAWQEQYDALLSKGVALRPTSRKSLNHIVKTGLPIAVVTTTEKQRAQEKLANVGLERLFATIVGGLCVANRKPHPDPYLLAAERLGVDTAACIAF
ncbi:MAG: HAD family phosphatase [Pseudomonadota bacterium]